MTRGFYGKLPSRGDFLRVGLPRQFTDPWDAWLAECLTASRARLGTDWSACWLEAPVWHFALSDNVCGPDPVLGVWVPSTDRVGRDFPLTVAAIGAAGTAFRTDEAGWLEVAAAAACDAVTQAWEPEALSQALQMSAATPPEGVAAAAELAGGALWWTAGAPHVVATRRSTAGLPAPDAFADMLRSTAEAG